MTSKQLLVLRSTLRRVAITQAKFWDALFELEKLTGMVLEGTYDFTGYQDPTAEDLDELLKAHKELAYVQSSD